MADSGRLNFNLYGLKNMALTDLSNVFKGDSGFRHEECKHIEFTRARGRVKCATRQSQCNAGAVRELPIDFPFLQALRVFG